MVIIRLEIWWPWFCCSSKYQKAMRRRKNFDSLFNWEDFEFVYPWLCDLPFFFLKKQWFFDTLLIFLKNWIINLSWNLDILKLQPISFPTIYNMSIFITKWRVHNFFTKKFVMSHLVVLVSWNMSYFVKMMYDLKVIVDRYLIWQVSRYDVHAMGHHKLFCEKNLYPLILKKHTHIIYRWKANWL